MGFWQSLFGGNVNDNPGWLRNSGRDIFNQFGDLYGAYNPQVEVGTGMENFDRMLQNQGAARGLATRGFNPSSNPTHDLTRARFGANLWTQANQNKRNWQRDILAQQFGMTGGLADLWKRHYQAGLGQQIGQAVGQGAATMAAAGAAGQQGVASPYGPTTPTPAGAEVPWNSNEGTNQQTGTLNPVGGPSQNPSSFWEMLQKARLMPNSGGWKLHY